MTLSATPTSLQDLLPWRDVYRHEMNCQIIHDSLHTREGWTQSYFLHIDSIPVGYGSIAIAGPWKDKPTIFEFYILPQHRSRLFDLFLAFQAAAGTILIETQTNDMLLSTLLHALAPSVASESILFHDKLTTALAPPPGAVFRAVKPEDGIEDDWVVTLDGAIAGTGGIHFHYNRPYGDIYMQIAEQHRRHGLGSFLVQEMKRICYKRGNTPAARCNPKNIASRKTLQKAGFVPCGAIVTGDVSSPPLAS